MGHRVEVLRNGERFHTLAHVQMLGKAVPKAPLSFPNIQFTAASTTLTLTLTLTTFLEVQVCCPRTV